jgi:hypothetical protein
MHKLHALALALFITAGCQIKGQYIEMPPRSEMTECYSVSMEFCRSLWYREALKRFANPVLIFCHGSDFGGQWMLTPDDSFSPPIPAEAMAKLKAKEFFPRPVLLVACNPGHNRIDVPNVFYFTDSIWLVPDEGLNRWFIDHPEQSMPIERLSKVNDHFKGSIWDAVTGDR